VSVEIDSTVFSAIVGGIGSVFATLIGAVVYLYQGRERDRAAFMTEMLAVAKTLREEDARTEADLRARLDAALASPPPSQRSSTTRTRKQR
jgi:hypothetical protein